MKYLLILGIIFLLIYPVCGGTITVYHDSLEKEIFAWSGTDGKYPVIDSLQNSANPVYAGKYKDLFLMHQHIPNNDPSTITVWYDYGQLATHWGVTLVDTYVAPGNAGGVRFQFLDQNKVEKCHIDWYWASGYTINGRMTFDNVDGTITWYDDGGESDHVHSCTNNIYYFTVHTFLQASYPGPFVYWTDYSVSSIGEYGIATMPHDWYVKKDLIDPDLSGIYDENNNVVYASTMHSIWSGNSITKTYSTVMEHVNTGTIVNTTSQSGMYWSIIEYDMADILFDADAPYGVYRISLYEDGVYAKSDYFNYIAGGAVVLFDQEAYASGDEGTITWDIEDTYWQPTVYDYEWRIYDVDGKVYDSGDVATQAGSAQITWDEDYGASDYFVFLYALEGDTEYLLNYDIATLKDTVRLVGHTLNAVTGEVVGDVDIATYQLGTWFNTTSDVTTGEYILDEFEPGADIDFIGAEKADYAFYNLNLYPPVGGTYHVDLYLFPPWEDASGIRGLVLDENTLESIEGATVNLWNDTYTNDTLSSITGYYQFIDLYTDANLTNEWAYGTITASSTYSGTYSGDKAFDNNVGTYWRAAAAMPQWVKVNYGAGVEHPVNRYTLQETSGSANYMCVNWTFQGSDDDATWFMLDDRSLIKAPNWADQEKRTYDAWGDWSNPENISDYQYYRLTCYLPQTAGSRVDIGEIEYWWIGTDIPYYYSVNSTRTGYDDSPDYNITSVLGEGVAQDIFMEGQYSLAVHLIDADTHAVIFNNATISSSEGSSGTTSNGTVYLTQPYGLWTITATATDYFPASSNILINDIDGEELTIEMTRYTPPATPAVPAIQPSPPHPVKFSVRTGWGSAIPDCNVTCQGVSTTLGDWSWLLNIMGIDTGETPIHNTTMTGTTGFNGEIDFMMVEEIQYNCTFSKAGTDGISKSILLYPHDSEYVITADDANWYAAGYSQEATANVTVTKTELTSTTGTINFVYQDALSQTGNVNATLLKANATDPSAPWVVLQTYNTTGAAVNHTFNVDHAADETYDYFLQVNATHNTFGEIDKTFGVGFTMPNPFEATGIPMVLWVLLGMGICMFTGALFGASNASQGLFVVCVEAWILYFIRIFSALGTVFAMALTLATVLALAALARDYLRTEGYP